MSVSSETVISALNQFEDPYYTASDLETRKAIKKLEVKGSTVELEIALGYPAKGVEDKLAEAIKAPILDIDGIDEVKLTLDWAVTATKTHNNLPNMKGIKNIIAIASGKGGVGKSTSSVNLALALSAEGAKVGLLDADIYGPSQPMMLGIPPDQRPEFIDQQHFRAIEAHGIQSMSMGYMVTDKTPMVWRGPMVSGALQQLLNQCEWGELDYLIVDMPPGTGDIQLTLAQKVPVSAAVIVTTPQDIALLDAKKGIEMFRKVDIPVLGIVENMATHICSNCGHEEHIFGEGGGERIADEYETELLGALPLDLAIREKTDSGKPNVIDDPEGTIAQTYREIARKMAARLAMQGHNEAPVVQIIATDT